MAFNTVHINVSPVESKYNRICYLQILSLNTVIWFCFLTLLPFIGHWWSPSILSSFLFSFSFIGHVVWHVGSYLSSFLNNSNLIQVYTKKASLSLHLSLSQTHTHTTKTKKFIAPIPRSLRNPGVYKAGVVGSKVERLKELGPLMARLSWWINPPWYHPWKIISFLIFKLS